MHNSPKASLIVADDHPIYLKGIRKALERVPFISEISYVNNGVDVINLLESKHFDLVLIDIRMKPLNGIETTRVIQEKFFKSKVIGLSMEAEESSVIQMIMNGAWGYISKSADKDEIIAALKTVMEGEKYFSKDISNILANRVVNEKKENTEVPNMELEKDRFKDILFLMCHELTTSEIANLMYLSQRTIEYYRTRIVSLTKSRNNMGIMKYAFRKGIIDDAKLKSKWNRVFKKKNINLCE